MDSDSEISEAEQVVQKILETTPKLTYDVLPKKSKARYEKAYEEFMNWCHKKMYVEKSF